MGGSPFFALVWKFFINFAVPTWPSDDDTQMKGCHRRDVAVMWHRLVMCNCGATLP